MTLLEALPMPADAKGYTQRKRDSAIRVIWETYAPSVRNTLQRKYDAGVRALEEIDIRDHFDDMMSRVWSHFESDDYGPPYWRLQQILSEASTEGTATAKVRRYAMTFVDQAVGKAGKRHQDSPKWRAEVPSEFGGPANLVPRHQQTDELSIRRMEEEAVAEAIDTLPEPQQSVIRMYFYDGMTLREIGRAFRRSAQWASDVKQKAQDVLRRRMDPPD